MQTIELIRLQLEIERIAFDEDGLMRRLPGPNPDTIPRFAVYRYPGGELVLFRGDVPPEERASPSGRVAGRFRTSTFDSVPAPGSYEGVVEEHGAWCIYEHGICVSRAFSSREGPRAAELAVETLPSFRRRGFARRVASAWAAASLAEGKVAFYSHALSNEPSARLARSLGATERFELVTYD